MATIPTLEGQRKHFKSLTDDLGISLVWDQYCKVPTASFHKGNATITLPIPSLENWDNWLGQANHEISHLFPEVLFTYDCIPNFKSQQEKDVANILCDYLCEYNRHGYWEGRDLSLWRMRAIVSEKYSDWTDCDPCISGTIEHLNRLRHPWQGMLPPLNIDPDAEEFIGKLESISIHSRLSEMLISGDKDKFLGLVREIIQESQGEPKESQGEPKESQGEPKESQGEPKESQGESKESQGEPKESQGEPKESQGEPKESQGEPKESQGEPKESQGEPKERKVSRGPVDSVSPSIDRSNVLPGEDDSSYEKGTYEPTAYHTVTKVLGISPNLYTKRKISDTLANSTLSRGIQKYLKIVSRDSFQYGKNSGTLNEKSIYKVYHQESPKIFKQREGSRIKTDAVLSLLVDCSGSMEGPKYAHAAVAAITLSKTLTDLRIPHEILGFTTNYKGLHTYVFKEFTERVSQDTLVDRFSWDNVQMNSNYDGESILIAAERLLSQKQQKKILIVLSDGEPCSPNGFSADSYLKKACELLENSKKISLIGLGIMDKNVERFYKTCRVINNIQELDRAVLETFKEEILC